MPTRDEITQAIHTATGNPDTGPVAESTPAIIQAIDELINGGDRTVTKANIGETRLMRGAENIRGE